MKETSLKRDHLKKEKSSNQHFWGDMLVSGPVRVKKHNKKEYGGRRRTEKQRKIVNMTWVEKTVASFHPKTTNPKPYRQDFRFVGDVGSFKL